tara:strand:- start:23 stop:943 length:921 start_codon:yes stop_codon:yes gene_type:complete
VTCDTGGVSCDNSNYVASGATNGEYFMYGNYLSIGISQYGTFGTYNSCTNSICTWGWTTLLGLRQDGDGWTSGSSTATGDFFLPGTKFYMWCIGYRTTASGSFTKLCNDRKNSGQDMTGITMTDTSDSGEKMLGVSMQWSNSVIQVDSEYTFHACSKKIKIEAKITNLGAATMYDPTFLISVDPDNEQEVTGNYQTSNQILGQKVYGDDYTSVCGAGLVSSIALCMSSDHAGSRAYKGLAFTTNPLDSAPGTGLESAGSAVTQDRAIALVTYGDDLEQNEQSADIGMYFGLGAVDDVKEPAEQQCS